MRYPELAQLKVASRHRGATSADPLVRDREGLGRLQTDLVTIRGLVDTASKRKANVQASADELRRLVDRGVPASMFNLAASDLETWRRWIGEDDALLRRLVNSLNGVPPPGLPCEHSTAQGEIPLTLVAGRRAGWSPPLLADDDVWRGHVAAAMRTLAAALPDLAVDTVSVEAAAGVAAAGATVGFSDCRDAAHPSTKVVITVANLKCALVLVPRRRPSKGRGSAIHKDAAGMELLGQLAWLLADAVRARAALIRRSQSFENLLAHLNAGAPRLFRECREHLGQLRRYGKDRSQAAVVIRALIADAKKSTWPDLERDAAAVVSAVAPDESDGAALYRAVWERRPPIPAFDTIRVLVDLAAAVGSVSAQLKLADAIVHSPLASEISRSGEGLTALQALCDPAGGAEATRGMAAVLVTVVSTSCRSPRAIVEALAPLMTPLAGHAGFDAVLSSAGRQLAGYMPSSVPNTWSVDAKHAEQIELLGRFADFCRSKPATLDVAVWDLAVEPLRALEPYGSGYPASLWPLLQHWLRGEPTTAAWLRYRGDVACWLLHWFPRSQVANRDATLKDCATWLTKRGERGGVSERLVDELADSAARGEIGPDQRPDYLIACAVLIGAPTASPFLDHLTASLNGGMWWGTASAWRQWLHLGVGAIAAGRSESAAWAAYCLRGVLFDDLGHADLWERHLAAESSSDTELLDECFHELELMTTRDSRYAEASERLATYNRSRSNAWFTWARNVHALRKVDPFLTVSETFELQSAALRPKGDALLNRRLAELWPRVPVALLELSHVAEFNELIKLARSSGWLTQERRTEVACAMANAAARGTLWAELSHMAGAFARP